ncbi:unnamed protein product [Caenorhabditis nigoni]
MSKNLTWSIETDLAFKVSTRSDSLSSRHERRLHNSDGNSQFECGWNDLMSTELLMSHLRGGNSNEIIFEINVLIKSMTGCGKEILRKFDESIKECSDVVLVVKDRKFYLLKYYLALQSAHFKELPPWASIRGNTVFFKETEESQKDEVELNDIDPDDFQNFLELIHGESSVDDDTIEGILNLADMFDAPTAIRRCEEYLLKNSQKKMSQKLQISLQYNLENLKTKCLSEITTISDIQSIVSLNFKEMDLSTSQALLQKSLEFSNK